MRREERVTVQGPVKEQQRDGMSHGGGGGPDHQLQVVVGGRSLHDVRHAGHAPWRATQTALLNVDGTEFPRYFL